MVFSLTTVGQKRDDSCESDLMLELKGHTSVAAKPCWLNIADLQETYETLLTAGYLKLIGSLSHFYYGKYCVTKCVKLSTASLDLLGYILSNFLKKGAVWSFLVNIQKLCLGTVLLTKTVHKHVNCITTGCVLLSLTQFAEDI